MKIISQVIPTLFLGLSLLFLSSCASTQSNALALADIDRDGQISAQENEQYTRHLYVEENNRRLGAQANVADVNGDRIIDDQEWDQFQRRQQVIVSGQSSRSRESILPKVNGDRALNTTYKALSIANLLRILQ